MRLHEQAQCIVCNDQGCEHCPAVPTYAALLLGWSKALDTETVSFEEWTQNQPENAGIV